jgi:hypothetical protein
LRDGRPDRLILAMSEADTLREAIRRYMAANNLNPTRWAIDAGLSERALAHFLSGRSKSLSPSTMAKLAKQQGKSTREVFGIAASYIEGTVTPWSEKDFVHISAVPMSGHISTTALSEQIANLHEELRSLREEMRANRSKPDPEKP